MTAIKKETIIVKKYLSDPNFENRPSLTLAKLIFADHPLEFTSLESVRTSIRRYRGLMGDKSRNEVKDIRFRKPVAYNYAPHKLPAEESKDEIPYILKGTNIGIISDLHIPNHRNEPLQVALDYFKKQKVNSIVINGDLLDNTPFTKHDGAKPSAEDVRRWFDVAEMFLENLREEFPKAEIVWLEGNHDFWYERWMREHAWVFGKDPYYTLESRLHLDDYKITYVKQNRYAKAGKLTICHGHFLLRGFIGPVVPARGIFMRTGVSVLVGHCHVETSYTNPNLHGDIITCWSTGCLCTLTPDYMPMGGKACHGFAHVLVEKGGNFSVKNYRINKGVIL